MINTAIAEDEEQKQTDVMRVERGEVIITELDSRRTDERFPAPWWKRRFTVLRAILCYRTSIPVSVLVLVVTLVTVLVPFTIIALVQRNQAHSLVGHAGRLGISVPLPYPLSLLRDQDDYPVNKNDIPFVWIVPQAGATTVDDVISRCYGLTSANDVGADAFHPHGIDQMAGDHTIYRKDVNFVYSNHLFDTARLFSEEHPGRLVASFRHPAERLYSLFMRKQARGDFKGVENMTFEDFIDRELYVPNWVTHYLGGATGPASEGHLDSAKQILWRKCLVMIAEEPDESIAHLETYFGWRSEDPNCPAEVITEDGSSVAQVQENTTVWRKILERNQLDVRLYEFAKLVFETQRYDLSMQSLTVYDVADKAAMQRSSNLLPNN